MFYQFDQSIAVVVEARGYFRNPEEGERPPLEAVTRRLVKTVIKDTRVCG
jgi:hypothetical protein